MEDQYGMSDLRQYLAAGNFFPPPPPQPHAAFSTAPYNIFAGGLAHGSNGGGARTGSAPTDLIEFRMDAGGLTDGGGGGGGTVRWPRQETLALLEIRSRLDSRFKEANQKGPLWEEVSRIMFEEHGYQRTGKKCREKFENLYKYYKKTKEGKAGRQDGKHYRFFRQLEALYGGVGGGESSSNSATASRLAAAAGGGFDHYNFPGKNISLLENLELSYLDPKISDTTSNISLSNSLNSDTTSSDYNDVTMLGSSDINEKLRKRKGKIRSFKAKIRDHIDAQMKEVVSKQEAWMEKMAQMIESKEQERVAREEQWRRQDAARIEKEHRQWEKERTWIKTRDAALMDAVQKLTGNHLRINIATSSLPDEPPMAPEFHQTNNNVWWPGQCGDDDQMSKFVQSRHGIDQGIDHHAISLNDPGNSPAGVGAVNNDGFFRYFLGDNGHGRFI